MASAASSPTVDAGHEIRWRATITPVTNSGLGVFSQIGENFEIYGNPLCLIYGDNFVSNSTFPSGSHAFYQMFKDCTTLTSAANLKFVVEVGRASCYREMFKGCTSLVSPPSTVTLLTTNERVCQSMFEGCSALTTAPIIPIVSSTGTGTCCYMFKDCTSLTAAPELSATTISAQCYRYMFQGCSSLTNIMSILPAQTMTSANYCYQGMFQDCKSITKTPILPALTLVGQSYQQMFSGCNSLNHVTILATDISATNCLTNWLSNVASTGTFVKNSSMTSFPSGASGIPVNWTVTNYVTS